MTAFDPFELTLEVTGRDASGATVSGSATVDVSANDTVPVTSTCTVNPFTACLLNRRFQVEVDWLTAAGNSGMARVIAGGRFPGGAEFYFEDASTADLAVLMNDSCAQDGAFFVSLAPSTTDEFTVIVTDTETGVTRPYSNPLGTPAQPFTDTSAFLTCAS